jgi:hypothetical protein
MKIIYGSFLPVCFPVFAQVVQILEKPKFIPYRNSAQAAKYPSLLAIMSAIEYGCFFLQM